MTDAGTIQCFALVIEGEVIGHCLRRTSEGFVRVHFGGADKQARLIPLSNLTDEEASRALRTIYRFGFAGRYIQHEE